MKKEKMSYDAPAQELFLMHESGSIMTTSPVKSGSSEIEDLYEMDLFGSKD